MPELERALPETVLLANLRPKAVVEKVNNIVSYTVPGICSDTMTEWEV